MSAEEMQTEVEQSEPVPLNYTPNEKSVDISKDQDGKLYKEILVPGEGDELPEDKSEVFVHYIGRLPDGTEFDRSKGEPFKFTLGAGAVIKGWDQGIATMKKKEKALLICHPDYAYGSRGQGSIPANSTLYFEVEMLYWKEEDLSKNKDGGILRHKLVAGGNKYYFPNDGAEVEVELEGQYNGRVFDERTVKFHLGEGNDANIPSGVEKALYKFTENERSRLTLQPQYAFGSAGNTDFGIPPGAVVTYTVHLKHFVKAKEAWQLNGHEKMELAREFKTKGTDYFTQAKFRLAAGQYKKIVDFLKTEAMLEGDEEEERKALILAAYLNQSICYIKVNDQINARKNAEEALLMDPKNVKGHFRLGLSSLSLNEPEEEKASFQKVLELDPNNKPAQQQLAVCDKLIKEHKNREKQIFSNMFEKFAKADTKKEELRNKTAINGLDDVDVWEKEDTQPQS